jgi:hypothetical protein
VSRENPSTVFQISWGEPNAERSGGAKPPSTEAVKKGANFLKKLPVFWKKLPIFRKKPLKKSLFMCGLRLRRTLTVRRPSLYRGPVRRSSERAFTKVALRALLRKCDGIQSVFLDNLLVIINVL